MKILLLIFLVVLLVFSMQPPGVRSRLDSLRKRMAKEAQEKGGFILGNLIQQAIPQLTPPDELFKEEESKHKVSISFGLSITLEA